MMLRLLIISVFFFSGIKKGNSQTVYIDVLTAPAMLGYSDNLKTQQKKTNDNLSAIEKGQLLVASQLKVANDLHDKVLKGLTEVSGTLTNALTVKDIYQNTADMLEDMKGAVQLAAGNPLLTAFAIQGSKEFKERSVKITSEVSRLLTGGEVNMMSAGERQDLLNFINNEIRILAATAYMIKSNMYWAKQMGIWRTINPFAQWKNNDTMIMRSVIEQAKRL